MSTGPNMTKTMNMTAGGDEQYALEHKRGKAPARAISELLTTHRM